MMMKDLYQRCGLNSNTSQLSVDIHNMHLLCYLLYCVCYRFVTREMNSHLDARVHIRNHMLPGG